MNLCKGLTFANKVEVKHALTISALKENKHFMINRLTKIELCVKCVDESCKWYVYAVMKPNLHGLWMVTVYVGPHTCTPIRVQNDGKMINCNFIATDILKKLCEDHTTPIKHLKSMIESKYEGQKPSTTRYGMRNKRRLGRCLGIGKSLTRGCKSCKWHILIRIRLPRCSIVPHPPMKMTQYF